MDNQENKRRIKEEKIDKNNFEDFDDEDETVEINYQDDYQNQYNQSFTPHNPIYQAQIPTMNFETENNIMAIFNAAKILMALGVCYGILILFIAISADVDGTTLLTYFILAGAAIFSAYLMNTIIKCLALTLHQTHEINKKINMIIKTQKKK